MVGKHTLTSPNAHSSLHLGEREWAKHNCSPKQELPDLATRYLSMSRFPPSAWNVDSLVPLSSQFNEFTVKPVKYMKRLAIHYVSSLMHSKALGVSDVIFPFL